MKSILLQWKASMKKHILHESCLSNKFAARDHSSLLTNPFLFLSRNKISFVMYLTFLLLIIRVPAYAYIAHHEFPEQIFHFISDITVNKDGSLDITETITVHANQTQIKNGLVRWLPTQEKTNNYFSALRYQLYDVFMDNKKLPFSVKRENKRFIIYIGDPKTLLAPGDYTYTIQYHVINAVDFLKNEDQLYWNITGNDWNFPIQHAVANITLPDDVGITHYMGYTGSTDNKYPFLKVILPQKNKISFITTQPLIIHRGLTVSIAWPKGFITPPPWHEQIKNILFEHVIALLFTVIIVLLFIIYSARLYKQNFTKRISNDKTEIFMKN